MSYGGGPTLSGLATLTVTVLAVTLSALGCGNIDESVTPTPTGSVIATVTVNGRPTPGVKATLSGPMAYQGVTEEDGRTAFYGVVPGSYSLEIAELADTWRFQRTTESVTVGASQSAQVIFEGYDVAQLTLVDALPDSSEAGVPLAKDLRVQATDAHGDPVPGVPLVWTAAADQGQVRLVEGGVTDGNGIGKARWVLGNLPGHQEIHINVASMPPLILSLTSFVAPAVKLLAINGKPLGGARLDVEDSISVQLEITVGANSQGPGRYMMLLGLTPAQETNWPVIAGPFFSNDIHEVGTPLQSWEVTLRPGERDTLRLTSRVAPRGRYAMGILSIDGGYQDWIVTPWEPVRLNVANTDSIPPELVIVSPSDTVLTEVSDSVVFVARDRGIYTMGYSVRGPSLGCGWFVTSWDGPWAEADSVRFAHKPTCTYATGETYTVVVTATDIAFNVAVDTMLVRLVNWGEGSSAPGQLGACPDLLSRDFLDVVSIGGVQGTVQQGLLKRCGSP